MRSDVVRLNKSNVQKIETPSTGKSYHYDDQLEGFCICATSAGSRIWTLYRRIQGRPVRMSLGKFPEVSPEDARRKAIEALGRIAGGDDPRRKRSTEMTFQELWDRFMEEHSKIRKKTWKEDLKAFRLYLYPLAKLRLSEVTRSRVRELHTDLREIPFSANRALALISKVFEFADEIEVWEGKNPAKKIRKYPEKARARFLQQHELGRFFDALRREPPQFRDLFMLCILTGSRKSKLLEMRGEQIDEANRTWSIPDTKNGEDIVVHLPALAIDILRARPRTGWVFPSHGASGHLVEPKASWTRIREASGLKDLRIHDLRRTLGSWQAMQGSGLPIIGKSLGHKSTKSTEVYARLSMDPIRDSVDRAVSAIFREDPPPPEPLGGESQKSDEKSG